MKRLLLVGTALAVLPFVAFGQTPVGLQVPKVTSIYCLPAIAKAKALGYGFVSLEASMPSSPTSGDMTAFRTACDAAVGSGLRVFVRLHCSVFGSGWGNVATPSYPPSNLWPQIRYCRSQYLDALALSCAKYHVDPSKEIVEDGNEMDMGGVGTPCFGTWGKISPAYNQFKKDWNAYKINGIPSYSYCKAEYLKLFPDWCWNSGPMPEGTIPAVAAKMLAAIRPADYHGFGEVVYTCEMADASTVGPREVASITGPDWQSLLSRSPIVDFNCYEDAPGSLTPVQAAAKWGGSKVPARIKLLLSNPLIKQVGVTECNLWLSRTTLSQVDAYRQALEIQAFKTPGLMWVGMFTAVEADLASSGTGFWIGSNGVLSPVGGREIGPVVGTGIN